LVEDEMEQYSSSLTNCADGTAYGVVHYFRGKITKDGDVEDLLDLPLSTLENLGIYLTIPTRQITMAKPSLYTNSQWQKTVSS
jgi:hypothetical protein